MDENDDGKGENELITKTNKIHFQDVDAGQWLLAAGVHSTAMYRMAGDCEKKKVYLCNENVIKL